MGGLDMFISQTKTLQYLKSSLTAEFKNLHNINIFKHFIFKCIQICLTLIFRRVRNYTFFNINI